MSGQKLSLKKFLLTTLPLPNSRFMKYARLWLFKCSKTIRKIIILLKPCSDEKQNGLKSLKLKRCKFLPPYFTPCENDCFCLKTLIHFRFKC